MDERTLSQLLTLPLFHGIQTGDLAAMLSCMGAQVSRYSKGTMLLCEGDELTHLLVLISGRVSLLRQSFGGRISLVGKLETGGLIGAAEIRRTPSCSSVSASADTACQVLALPFTKLLFTCNLSCRFHHRIVENLVLSISEFNSRLSDKLAILSQNSIRDRLLLYLHTESLRQQSEVFSIPYSRAELAAYLCVNRSAMTRELSRLQKEGLLRFDRQRFLLLPNSHTHYAGRELSSP